MLRESDEQQRTHPCGNNQEINHIGTVK